MTWTDPQIGIEIGGFRLDAVLGRGGMGTVYRATQLRLNRSVALKIMPPSSDQKGRKRVDRFIREAQVAASLNHMNVVQIFDAGEHGGLLYMAMELVEGKNLHEIVARLGPRSEADACSIFLQCARALEAALEKNLIHRDIKPENIMITSKGQTKVADFGLARDVADVARITAPGAVIGTPAFMSPEQGCGQDVDHRSDLYSLGATMYFALTARFPYYDKNPAKIIFKHLNDPIPNPRQFNPAVSDAFAMIVRRLMEKKPEDRYQHVGKLIEDLEHLMEMKKVAPPGPAPSTTVGDSGASVEVQSREGPRVDLSSPIMEGPPHAETLEVPTDAYKVRRHDPDRFVLETSEGFGDSPPRGGPTLAEVESDHFQVVPGLQRAPDLDSALLAVRRVVPEQKIFLFSRESVYFGRQAIVVDPIEGEIKVELLLRALPCRSKEEDPENYKKNLTISRVHAAFRVEENQVVLVNRKKNQGLSVEGKAVPSGRSLRLPETSLVAISQKALLLSVRIFPTEDSGRLFRIFGEPLPDGEGLLGAGGRCRIECVRITRPSNAPSHSYVILVRTATIGEGEEDAIQVPNAGRGARIYFYRREYFVGASEGGAEVTVDGRKVRPGFLAPLSRGAVLGIGSAEMVFRLPLEDDFKTL